MDFGVYFYDWKAIILVSIPLLLSLLSGIELIKILNSKQPSRSDKLLELERRIEQLEKKLE